MLFLEMNFRKDYVAQNSKERQKVNPHHHVIMDVIVGIFRDDLDCGSVQHWPIDENHVYLANHGYFGQSRS